MTKKTSDALEILRRRYYDNNPERQQALEEAFIDDDVSRKIRELRTNAGLTMRELAKLIGTTPSVISRLENADYEGHSLAMLKRIATALEMQVKIDFVPKQSSEMTGNSVFYQQH